MLFTSLCGVLGGRTCAAEPPTGAGMEGHRLFLAAGTVSQSGQHRSPSHWPGHAQGSAQQHHGQNHTQLCPSSYPGTVTAPGAGRAQPKQHRGGRGGTAPSLVPELLPEEMPALLLGRGLWLTHHAAAPSRSIHPPSRPGVPCHLGCSTCAHVPKHERMVC